MTATITYKDSEKDHCYNCSHLLGDHRMSGRCDKLIKINNARSDCDCTYHLCGCQQYQFKEIVSMVAEEEEDLR